MKKSKKSSLRHSFKERLAESIKSEIMDENPHTEYVDHSLDGVPLLENGKTNISISNERLYNLPQHLRRWSCWSIIDFERLEAKPSEEPTTNNPFVQIGIDAEKPLDVFKINKDRKNKIKAIVFGEVSNQRKEEGGD